MGNCSCSSVLAVAIDARVTSERDGSPAIIYNDPSQWRALLGATAIEVFPLILGTEATPTLTVIAESALDGKKFDPVPEVQARCTWSDFDTCKPQFISLNRTDAAPITRFGLQVAGAGGTQAAVRLTLMVVVYRETRRATHVETTAVSVSGMDQPIQNASEDTDSIVDTTICEGLVVRVTGDTITSNLDLELRTSDDGTNWHRLIAGAGGLQISASNTTDLVAVSPSDGLLRFARLYTTSTNGGSAGEVEASLWVRT